MEAIEMKKQIVNGNCGLVEVGLAQYPHHVMVIMMVIITLSSLPRLMLKFILISQFNIQTLIGIE